MGENFNLLAISFRCLPVLDGRGACVGIVTMRDILAWSLVQCLGGSTSCGLPEAA